MKHQEQLKKLQPISLIGEKMKIDDEYVCVAGTVEFGNGDIVLEISIYENSYLKPEALVRHFMDIKNQNFGTYFVKDATVGGVTHKAGEWSRMQYTTIIGKQFYGSYYKPKKTRHVMNSADIIRQYFKKEFYGSNNLEYLIEKFETDVNYDRKITAEERKRERIGHRMEFVKPTDNKFRKWILESIFPERYLFARENTKEGRICYCTACQKRMMIKDKVVHNQNINCPECGSELVVKTRQQTIKRKANVMVIQPYNSVNYVIRHFRVYLHDGIIQGNKVATILKKEERIRIFYGEDYNADIYYETQYMADEQDQGWWTQKNGTVIDKQMYLYPEGILDIFAERGLRETLYKMATEKWLFNYNDFIRVYFGKPYLEYLVKAGLTKLTMQFTSWYSDSFVNRMGENLNELLRLNGNQVNRIKEINGGKYAIVALQAETVDNPISMENLEYIDNNNIRLSDLCTEKTNLKWNKVLNYLRRQQKKNGFKFEDILQYYRDYIQMSEDKGMDATDDIIRLNARLVEWHDRYVEEAEKIKIDIRNKEVNTKYKDIAKNYERNCEMFAWQDKELAIVVPKKASDIVREGRLQHHCVADGDIYIKNMNEDKGFILFLRKKEDLDKPYYTIELSPDWDIKQRNAAFNRKPDINNIDAVLKKWIKSKKPRKKKVQVEV